MKRDQLVEDEYVQAAKDRVNIKTEWKLQVYRTSTDYRKGNTQTICSEESITLSGNSDQSWDRRQQGKTEAVLHLALSYPEHFIGGEPTLRELRKGKGPVFLNLVTPERFHSEQVFKKSIYAKYVGGRTMCNNCFVEIQR